MKTVFISQPINGKSNEVIIEERKKALEEVKIMLGEDVYTIPSFFNYSNIQDIIGNVPLFYLSKSILMLSAADVAYFAKGYENARGCQIEFQCAKEYGLPYLTYHGDKGNF